MIFGIRRYCTQQSTSLKGLIWVGINQFVQSISRRLAFRANFRRLRAVLHYGEKWGGGGLEKEGVVENTIIF